MQLEARKYLFDIKEVARLLNLFTDGKSVGDYINDPLLQSAVETQLEIIGEATRNLERHDSSIVAHISDYRKLINFRNILIHGYTEVDDYLVWDLLQHKLPVLVKEIDVFVWRKRHKMNLAGRYTP